MSDCAHCRQPRRGYGQVNEHKLCHPDTGPDCYRLVTVYHHPMPCDCALTPDGAKTFEYVLREVVGPDTY